MRDNMNNREGNMTIKRRVVSIINYIKFIYFLSKGIFEDNSPEIILRIIQKFISLQTPFYENTIVMGRSTRKSCELLGTLIDSYLETKSDITLEQVLTVLKEEFIKRNNRNGRK